MQTSNELIPYYALELDNPQHNKKVKQKKNKKNINKNKKTKYEEIKNKVKDFILKYYYILIISLPFILIDIITKILGYKIHFYGIFQTNSCKRRSRK